MPRRVAVLIGNNNYQKLPPLAAPVRDAQRFAACIANLGFAFINPRAGGQTWENLGAVDLLENAPQSLYHELTGGDVEVALFFFAGHGSQGDQNDSLLATDATNQEGGWRPSLVLEELIDRICSSNSSRSIPVVIILDACRDRPKELKSAIEMSRYWKRGRMPHNILVLFSTQSGAGAFADSPFVDTLIKHIATPGRGFRDALGDVEVELKSKASSQKAVLVGRIDFNNALKNPVAEVDTTLKEKKAIFEFSVIQRSGCLKALRGFIDTFEGESYAVLGKARAMLHEHTPPAGPASRHDADQHSYPTGGLDGFIGVPSGAVMINQLAIEVPTFEIGKGYVTRGQFRVFVEAAQGNRDIAEALVGRTNKNMNGAIADVPRATPLDPHPLVEGYTDGSPVVAISYWWAERYIEWLNKTYPGTYRLASEIEWRRCLAWQAMSSLASWERMIFGPNFEWLADAYNDHPKFTTCAALTVGEENKVVVRREGSVRARIDPRSAQCYHLPLRLRIVRAHS